MNADEEREIMTFSYNLPTQTVSCEISVAEVEQLTQDGIKAVATTIENIVAQVKAAVAPTVPS